MPMRPWNLSADRMKTHSLLAARLGCRSHEQNIDWSAGSGSGPNT